MRTATVDYVTPRAKPPAAFFNISSISTCPEFIEGNEAPRSPCPAVALAKESVVNTTNATLVRIDVKMLLDLLFPLKLLFIRPKFYSVNCNMVPTAPET